MISADVLVTTLRRVNGMVNWDMGAYMGMGPSKRPVWVCDVMRLDI